jgi:hypothetical protein
MIIALNSALYLLFKQVLLRVAMDRFRVESQYVSITHLDYFSSHNNIMGREQSRAKKAIEMAQCLVVKFLCLAVVVVVTAGNC